MQGALLLKHGRHGKPKVHFFRVTSCDTLLRWRSASGSVKQVRLARVTEVVAGQGSEVFRRYPLREPPVRSFSLHYCEEDGSSRTLDLTCADERQFELWHAGLRVVAARLRAMGGAPPAAQPAGSAGALIPTGPGAPTAPPLAAVLGSSGSGGAGGISPADLGRCLSTRLLEVRKARRQGLLPLYTCAATGALCRAEAETEELAD
jgi:hypothetical protein